MWYWNFNSIHKWDLSENIIRPTAVSKEPSWQISIYVYSTWYMVPLRYMEYRSRSVNLVFAQKEAQIFFMWTKIAFQYISFQHWITCFSLLWSKTQNTTKQQKISIAKLSNIFMFFKIPVAFETSSFGWTPTLDCK